MIGIIVVVKGVNDSGEFVFINWLVEWIFWKVIVVVDYYVTLIIIFIRF